MLDVRPYAEGRIQPPPAPEEPITNRDARRAFLVWFSAAVTAVHTFANLESVLAFSRLITRAVALWRENIEILWLWIAQLFSIDLPLGMGNVLTFVIFIAGTSFAGVRWRAQTHTIDVRALSHFLVTCSVVALVWIESEKERIPTSVGLAIVLTPFLTYPFSGPMRDGFSRLLYVAFVALLGLSMIIFPLVSTGRDANKQYDIEQENDGIGDMVEACLLNLDQSKREACVAHVTTRPSTQTSFVVGLSFLYLGMFALPFFISLGYLNKRLLFVSVGVLFLMGFNALTLIAEGLTYEVATPLHVDEDQ